MSDKSMPVDADRLQRAADCLSQRERDLLMLSASEGLDLAAAARGLGLEPAEAERMLAYALIKLDRALCRMERPWWHFW